MRSKRGEGRGKTGEGRGKTGEGRGKTGEGRGKTGEGHPFSLVSSGEHGGIAPTFVWIAFERAVANCTPLVFFYGSDLAFERATASCPPLAFLWLRSRLLCFCAFCGSDLAFCVFVPFVAPIVWIAKRANTEASPLHLFGSPLNGLSPVVSRSCFLWLRSHLLCFCAFCGSHFVAPISPFVFLYFLWLRSRLLCFCAFYGSDLAFERAVASCPPLVFFYGSDLAFERAIASCPPLAFFCFLWLRSRLLCFCAFCGSLPPHL